MVLKQALITLNTESSPDITFLFQVSAGCRDGREQNFMVWTHLKRSDGCCCKHTLIPSTAWGNIHIHTQTQHFSITLLVCSTSLYFHFNKATCLKVCFQLMRCFSCVVDKGADLIPPPPRSTDKNSTYNALLIQWQTRFISYKFCTIQLLHNTAHTSMTSYIHYVN